jgi:hypothetical protein
MKKKKMEIYILLLCVSSLCVLLLGNYVFLVKAAIAGLFIGVVCKLISFFASPSRFKQTSLKRQCLSFFLYAIGGITGCAAGLLFLRLFLKLKM